MSVSRAVPAPRRRLRRASGRFPGACCDWRRIRPCNQEGARRRGAESSAVTVAATSAMVRVRAGTRTWADGGVRVSCAFAPWWGRPAEGPQDDGTCSDLSGFLRGRSKLVSAMWLPRGLDAGAVSVRCRSGVGPAPRRRGAAPLCSRVFRKRRSGRLNADRSAQTAICAGCHTGHDRMTKAESPVGASAIR